MAERYPAVAIGAVIESKDHPGQILVIRESTSNVNYGKKSGALSIPVGRLAEDESLFETLKRELVEETGYADVQIDNVLGFYQIPGAVGIVCIATVEGEPSHKFNQNEVSEVFWMDPNDILAMSEGLRPAMHEITTDYLAGKKYPISMIVDVRK